MRGMVEPNPKSARFPKSPSATKTHHKANSDEDSLTRTRGSNNKFALTRMPVPKTPANTADCFPRDHIDLTSITFIQHFSAGFAMVLKAQDSTASSVPSDARRNIL